TTVPALAVLALLAVGCVPPGRVTASPKVPAAARVSAPAIQLAPLIDARPAVSKRAHGPNLSRYTGFLLATFAFGTGRADGPEAPGDGRIDIVVEGARGPVASQVEAYV